jgi:hypothetical protein
MNYRPFNKSSIALIAIITSSISFALVKIYSLELPSSILEEYWQFLDIPSLIKDPLNSILYLHSQPPMLNILVSIFSIFGDQNVFKIFIGFNSICIGLTTTIIFIIIAQRSDSIFLGSIFAFLYLVFPSTMLNAGYSFYPAMTAFMYSFLLLGFHLSDYRPKLALLTTSAAIVLLTLTRGSFTLLHVIFFFFIFSLYTYKYLKNTKMLSIFGILVILVSSSTSIKNFILYDFFGSSSWTPMNIAYGTGIPRDQWYWMTPSQIKEAYPNLSCKNSYHYQDSSLTKANGSPNFNSCLIIEYGRIVSSESLPNYNPLIHGKYFLSNTAYYFAPSDKYRELTNRSNIKAYADVVNLAQLTIKISDKHEIRILLLLILLLSLYCAIQKKDKFLILSIVMIMSHYVSHAITDGYESQRFVFDVEFIFFILFAMILKYFQTSKSILAKR